MDGVRTQVVSLVGQTSPPKSLTGRPEGTTNCGHLALRDEHAKEIPSLKASSGRIQEAKPCKFPVIPLTS